MVVEKNDGRLLALAGVVCSAVAITTAFVQSESNNGSALTRTRDLPDYTASGDLIQPKNFNAWAFANSPLTPNALKRHAWRSR